MVTLGRTGVAPQLRLYILRVRVRPGPVCRDARMLPCWRESAPRLCTHTGCICRIVLAYLCSACAAAAAAAADGQHPRACSRWCRCLVRCECGMPARRMSTLKVVIFFRARMASFIASVTGSSAISVAGSFSLFASSPSDSRTGAAPRPCVNSLWMRQLAFSPERGWRRTTTGSLVPGGQGIGTRN